MTPELSAFLAHNPLATRWLDEIIGVLLGRFNGAAHVREIARALAKVHDIDSIEQTITRRINDFCSDADDFDGEATHDLFQRVDAATYRLRSFPKSPAIIELIRIAFREQAMQLSWEDFAKIASQSPKWPDASNERKLEAFAKAMTKPEWQTIYDGHREFLTKPLAPGDLGL